MIDSRTHIHVTAKATPAPYRSMSSDASANTHVNNEQSSALQYRTPIQAHPAPQHEGLWFPAQPSVFNDNLPAMIPDWRPVSREFGHSNPRGTNSAYPALALELPHHSTHGSIDPRLLVRQPQSQVDPRDLRPVTDQYSSNFAIQPYSGHSTYPRHQVVQGLFGAAHTQYVAVAGTSTALDLLQQAVASENLKVSESPQACNDALISSLKPLQAKGVIADPDAPDSGEGRFALDEMSWYERAAFDINPDDFLVHPANSVQSLGRPPFQGRIDFILGFLRIMAKYHSFTHSTCYQLGVLTRSGTQCYEVQIFKAERGTQPTHTVWMYRECIGDVTVDGGWTELWYPFNDSSIAPSLLKGPNGVDMSQSPHQIGGINQWYQSHINHSVRPAISSSIKKKPQPIMSTPHLRATTSQAFTETASQSIGATIKSGVIADRLRWKGAQHKQNVAHLFTHLTDEEILSGQVHPDNIVGTLMLRLVPRYSNSTLWERINNLYKMLDPTTPKTVSPCAIAKRWTLALQHICKSSGMDYQTEMNRYLDLRRQNGILTKSAAPKRTTEETLDDDGEDEEVDGRDDEAAAIGLVKEHRSRGKRTRSVVDYAVFASGDFEEDEYNGMTKGSSEADGRRSKRQKMYKEDDEEYSEHEQNDGDDYWS